MAPVLPRCQTLGLGWQPLYTGVGQFQQTLCQSHEAMVLQEKVWYLAIGTPIGETNLSRLVIVLGTPDGYQYP